MEIGSFLELDIERTGEYFPDNENVARLNSARAGIYHSLQVMQCDDIYVPYYQCPTVNSFLGKKGVKIYQYYLSNTFKPLLNRPENKSAILIVNYFGIFSNEYFKNIQREFQNVIIDNGPAFYNPPIEGCFNVYSARKFFGVPDGCYVVGPNANDFTNEYSVDYSSPTAGFLFQRHEFGCSASYKERMKNEERIDNADVLRMSHLTRTLLGGINYQRIRNLRRNNFQYAHEQYKSVNLLNVSINYDDSCVPIFYPLVVENDSLVEELAKNQIYTGRRWNSVLNEVKGDTFEAWLSRYMVPLPVDQRYGSSELDKVFEAVFKILGKGMA
jgi:hypothetical protein